MKEFNIGRLYWLKNNDGDFIWVSAKQGDWNIARGSSVLLKHIFGHLWWRSW